MKSALNHSGPKKGPIRIVVALGLFASTLAAFSAAAQAQTPRPMASQQLDFGLEPWPMQRVVLLLPLVLAPDWNVNREQTVPLLKAAEARMQLALQRTGKFSTTQVHRYNPLILRSVQETPYTREQADALIAAPTLEGVQAALGTMNFDQPPLIAQVTLNNIATTGGTSSPAIRLTATGRLYELTGTEPFREAIATSNPHVLSVPQGRRGRQTMVRLNPADRFLSAAESAFDLIARDFVRPMETISFPDPVETIPLTGTVVLPPGTAPAAQVFGTFEIPRN